MSFAPTLLADRTLIALSGEDARPFLQGLITNDIDKLTASTPLFACILTPQGKWLHEFFLYQLPDSSLLLDVQQDHAAPLMALLKKYKLRSKVQWEAIEEAHIYALQEPPQEDLPSFPDPRHPDMGYRIISDTALAIPNAPEEYQHHRTQLSVPDGAYDATERSLPIELGYDLLNGVDFAKGCYVGQEVTARMHYRNVRRRIPATVESAQPLPATGASITIGDQEIGELRSHYGTIGLAIIKLVEATEAQEKITAQCGAQEVQLTLPAWLPTAQEPKESVKQ